MKAQAVAAATANADALAGKWSNLRFDVDEKGMRVAEAEATSSERLDKSHDV